MAGTLGTLFVMPRFQGMYQGVFAAGSKLFFYQSGTDTPLETYADQALSVSNSNPVTADAYGLFGPIYLLDRAYKVVLKTSSGVEVWSQDPVRPYTMPALSRVDPSVCDARLTLSSGTPVTTSDVTAATTVYVTPYNGNQIALYSSTYGWDLFTFSELSISLGSDAASLPYDVFAYISSGAVAVERLAWTNGTTRATNLTTQNGVLVKSGDASRRYLGTYRTTSTIGQTEDSVSKRFVWNYANRVRRSLRRLDDTNSWAYTTGTWRQANNSTSNQVEFVIGWAESLLEIVALGRAANTNAGVTFATGIGLDLTNAPLAGCVISGGQANVANQSINTAAQLRTVPSVGYHFAAWLEYSEATGTTTWTGDAGLPYWAAGMTGSIDA
jgi:hypothetical protein